MNSELISVVIPIYNCDKYLNKCIRSVLNQTYNKFELILINDGSKDKSGEICEKYSKLDNRIVYINQKNKGVSKTRQKGIEIAKGEYLIFIDSDDYIDKDYFFKLYNNCKRSNADIVCCNSNDFGVINYKNNKIEYDEVVIDKERLMNDYFKGMRYAYCIWGKLYKKSIINRVKFREMKYAEDTCMIIELFNKCEKVCLLEYDGYYYRGQETSITNTISCIEKANDLLIRADIINNICMKEFPNLINKSTKELVNSLYSTIAIYSKINDKVLYKDFLKKYKVYYKNVNKKYMPLNLKSLILIIFNINHYFVKGLLNRYYKIKGVKI